MNIPDIRAQDHGTIWLLAGKTPLGEEWINDHVAFEHFFGGAGVVEWRYIAAILNGARDDGLTVEVQ